MAGNEHRCTDYKGRVYRSKKEMLAAYGLTRQAYHQRLKKGMTQKEALEKPPCPGSVPTTCKDHKGNEYPSKLAMAQAYGRRLQTLCSRLERGVPLKDALELDKIPYRTAPTAYKDHKGNEYPSQSAMAKAYGRDLRTLRYRLEKGVPLKDALELDKIPRMPEQGTTAKKPRTSKAPMIPAKDGAHGGYRPAKACIDHEGREFPSASAMCRHWTIDQATYRARLRAGWDLKTTLTAPPQNSPAPIPCTDHEGNAFPSIRAMCAAYKIKPENFRAQLKKGKPLSDILGHRRNK